MKTISEILNTEDYGELTHEETLLLIEYERSDAVEEARKQGVYEAYDKAAREAVNERQNAVDSFIDAIESLSPPIFQVVSYGKE